MAKNSSRVSTGKLLALEIMHSLGSYETLFSVEERVKNMRCTKYICDKYTFMLGWCLSVSLSFSSSCYAPSTIPSSLSPLLLICHSSILLSVDPYLSLALPLSLPPSLLLLACGNSPSLLVSFPSPSLSSSSPSFPLLVLLHLFSLISPHLSHAGPQSTSQTIHHPCPS